jgi:hypothetical protein
LTPSRKGKEKAIEAELEVGETEAEVEVDQVEVQGEMVSTLNSQSAAKGLRDLVRRSTASEIRAGSVRSRATSIKGETAARPAFGIDGLIVLSMQAICIPWIHRRVGIEYWNTPFVLTCSDRTYADRRYYVLTDAGKPVFCSYVYFLRLMITSC